MSAYAESAASFKHRCGEIGLSTTEINALETQNIKTFNNLAYAVCGQPGQLDNMRFGQVMDGAFHSPTIGLESMMRQLSYEAITVAVAAIRQRVEPHPEGQLKRLPPQERDERIRKQAASIRFSMTTSRLTQWSTSSRPCWKRALPNTCRSRNASAVNRSCRQCEWTRGSWSWKTSSFRSKTKRQMQWRICQRTSRSKTHLCVVDLLVNRLESLHMQLTRRSDMHSWRIRRAQRRRASKRQTSVQSCVLTRNFESV